MTGYARAVAERRMILSYATSERRAGLAALLALDDALAAILRSTRDPMAGQLRLTWWYEALIALDARTVPAEPVLQALARDVVPRVAGAALAGVFEGWEELLDSDPLDDARLSRFAAARGGGIFAVGGLLLDASDGDPLADAGRGWALADLAMHVRDGGTAERALALATAPLATAAARRWSRAARPLGAMMHLARMDVDAGPARVSRALWHRLTGR